jgi:transcription-repair coupling factor (superfamily II helicase)
LIEQAMATTALDLRRPEPRTAARRVLVASAIEGLDALYLAQAAEQAPGGQLLHVARDAGRAAHLAELIGFFATGLEVMLLPAWDCLPYDRTSPNPDIMARRLDALARLLEPGPGPLLVLTTVNALVQKVPPAEVIRGNAFKGRAGERIDREALLRCLARNGYRRSGAVVEPGEYAVRGGIIDLFAPSAEQPLRLDLFGDELETVRTFDPLTQRSLGKVDGFSLRPVSEVILDPDAVERFRVGYLQRFGAATEDPLFESVTGGRPFPGMEHWLPLFHEKLVDLGAYLGPEAPVCLDPLASEALLAREETIGEHYEARRAPSEAARSMGAVPYRPLPPEELYLGEAGVRRLIGGRRRIELSTFAAPPAPPDDGAEVVDLGGRAGREFAAERARHDLNLFDAVVEHVRAEARAGRRLVVAAASAGSAERLRAILEDHGLGDLRRLEAWAEIDQSTAPAIAVLPLERGFTTAAYTILAEADILGERLSRPARRQRRSDKFIADVAALGENDLVVHSEHGIGRFEGLATA